MSKELFFTFCQILNDVSKRLKIIKSLDLIWSKPKIQFKVPDSSLLEHIVSFPLFKSCFSNDSVIINIWWGRTYTYTFFVYSNHYYCSRKLWNPFQVLWETIEGLVLPPIEISYKVLWKKNLQTDRKMKFIFELDNGMLSFLGQFRFRKSPSWSCLDY